MIRIQKSKSADTRSAETLIAKDTLWDASIQHIEDVKKALQWFESQLARRGGEHDFTKLEYIDEFHADFIKAQTDKSIDFRKLPWFRRHITTERHHLSDRVPDDVDMFDVMERIADIVMAGMGRTGKVYPDKLPAEVLQRAYQNTIELLMKNVEVATPQE